MDVRLTWTDCDEAGDYVVPNVLSPRDLVSRPDNMDETVPHVEEYETILGIEQQMFIGSLEMYIYGGIHDIGYSGA